MRLVQAITFNMLACAGAVHGQTILNQFSVPFFESSQFAAPDGSGGLILFNLTDNSLRRFDSTGKQLWSVAFNFGSAQGAVSAMAVTPDGVLLGGQVTGSLPGQTSAGSYDAFAAKYDFNGNSVWTKQFGTANGEYARVVAVSPAGFYVLGVSDGPNRLFIRQSDANGAEMWTRYFNDPSLNDIFGGSADATGVYFFGEEAAGYNVLRKFDSSGNDVLTHAFEQSAIITSVAADGQGVYVSYLTNSDGSYVGRVDLTGQEAWQRRVNASDVSNTIFTDGTGFYLAGGASGALPGQCYAGEGDIFLTRFDANANPMWTREFGTAAFDRSLQVSIASSAVYLTSSVSDNTVSLTTLSKTSPPSSGSQPSILNECVLNAASFIGGGVAPGEIVTILGSGLGPPQLANLQPSAGGQIATALDAAQVLFNGEPAPVIYASDGQSSAIVPYDIAGQTQVNVQVQYNGALSKAVTLPVFDSRLGIFTFGAGSGQAAVINQDGAVNSPSNPAAAGSVVSIFATGGGLPTPLGADNQIIGATTSSLKDSVYVRLYDDGTDPEFTYSATVLYYGPAPQAVPGLIQINAQLPASVPPADAVPLYIVSSATGTIEQAISIAVR